MRARQITTYAVHSRAIREETILPVTLEADEPRHLESGVINLYPDIRYQEIEGFGGALTDTVGYLYSRLTPECRRQFLEDCFGPDGQRYRFIRMHIDSCDYSLDEYQAVADPLADPDFTTFTLARRIVTREHHVFPETQDIRHIRITKGILDNFYYTS